MWRATRILALLFAVCVVLFMGTRVAKADDLSIGGSLTITPVGATQVFTFGNPTAVTVQNTTPFGDSALGAPVTIDQATLVSATGTQFSPATGNFSLGTCGTTGLPVPIR
jgi:hypothetical protein